jgi:hypothetical protein
MTLQLRRDVQLRTTTGHDEKWGERVLQVEERREHQSRSELRKRIATEYREMAGLSLTKAQACRLFRVEPERFERILRELVDEGVLRVHGDQDLIRGQMP